MSRTNREETESGLTTQLRTHLKGYSNLIITITSSLKDVNQTQSELDIENKPLPLIKPRLERQLDLVGEQAQEEMKRIDYTLETIDMLLAIQQQQLLQKQAEANLIAEAALAAAAAIEVSRRGALKKRTPIAIIASPVAFPVSQFPPSTTTTTTTTTSPMKQIPSVPATTVNFASQLQRQQEMQQQFLQNQLQQQQQMQAKTSQKGLSANSQNPLAFPNSPHGRATSPRPLLPTNSNSSGIITGMGLGAMPSTTGTIPQQPPPTSTPISQPLQQVQSQVGPIRKNSSIKTRRDALAGQLPLKAGRQVAFRQPKKDLAVKEEWILARIENCIGTDKHRYVVYDVDYDPENPTPDAGRFATTLKSIVPLPDPRDKIRTYPEIDYPKGTQVMALYPDTTSFYSAKIVAGPLIEKNKLAKKEKVYHVVFDEDGGKVEPVPMELVVEIPQ